MKTLLILVSLLGLSSVAQAATLPDFPMSFWGSVTVDGVQVPAGTVVRVYDSGSVKVGEVQVIESGVYGYTEPTKQKLIVGETDGLLSFTIQTPAINGGIETAGIVPVTHTDGFESGETVNKNLAFVVSTTVVPPRSSSGGGGGGKSVKQSPKPTPTVAGVIAATTSSSTDQDQKAALQKQLIVLLLQLIELLKLRM